MEKNIKPGTYRHYKDNYYWVFGTAKHSETLEDLVVYRVLHENDTSELWVRPPEMFTELVEVDGKQVPRFEYVEDAHHTIEELHHFRCTSCAKWWSVGDVPGSKKEWHCPWCGYEQ